MRRFIVFLTAIFALTACSMSEDTALAEAQVARFHDDLNAQQFEALYDNGAKELKAAATKAEFVAFLEAVNRKLGAVTASDKVSWNVNYHTSGSFVTLSYETTFTNGKGTEQFVYKLSDDKALLVGYHINSKELIIR